MVGGACGSYSSSRAAPSPTVAPGCPPLFLRHPGGLPPEPPPRALWGGLRLGYGVGRGLTRTGALRGFWGLLAALQPSAKFVALRLDFFPPPPLAGSLLQRSAPFVLVCALGPFGE